MVITMLTSNEQALGEIGSRIRSARIETPLTQAELAKRAGVSLSTVAKLERGEDVRFSSVLDVLRALGMLGAVDSLVPQVLARPSDLARAGKPRQRARSAAKGASSGAWEWGDGR